MVKKTSKFIREIEDAHKHADKSSLVFKSSIRELTPSEQARLLTQEQVDVLPEETKIMVKWCGGNGPHLYKAAHRNGKTYGDLISGTPVGGSDGDLFPVGTEPCQNRVFLPKEVEG